MRLYYSAGLSAVVLALSCGSPAAQARSSQWWYVAQGADRVLFIDEKSIEHDGDVANYAARQILRDPGNEAASLWAQMRTDCARRTEQWLLVMRYGSDDRPLDSAGAGYDEVQPVEKGTLGEAELDFVCAADRSQTGGFPIEIDDVAFADALIANDDPSVSPSALHARLKADPATPVIRSSAPPPATFGAEQSVATGQPIVPPRDYAKGVEALAVLDYDADETGRIYDVAYQGIEGGEIVFELRGYGIGDLVHPGSGQMLRVPAGAKEEQIGDLFITIIEAAPDSLRYRVERRPAADGASAP